MSNLSNFFYFYCFAILPGYILPVTGVYLSIRPYAKHWWPTLPEIQLIIFPLVIYGILLFMHDRQGYSIGLPSLIIAVPVMVTLWLGPGENDLWMPILRNIPYWSGFLCSILTVIAVYYFYPYSSLRY